MEKNFLIYNIISISSTSFLAINTILFFKSYRNKPVAFKIFSYYLLFILLIQLTTLYMRLNKITNLYFSHYYFVGQFIFLSLFYINLEKRFLIKKIIKSILFISLISVAVYYYIYPEDYFGYNVSEVFLTSIFLIIYSFLFFLKKIDSPDKKFIYINSGFFLYITCSTLLFAAGNIESSIKSIVWYSNVSLYLVYQLLIFIEWYKHFRKPYQLPTQTDV